MTSYYGRHFRVEGGGIGRVPVRGQQGLVRHRRGSSPCRSYGCWCDDVT